MSLMSKFTSLFGSSQTTQGAQTPSDPRLEEVLEFIMRPAIKFNIRAATSLMTIFVLEKEEHIDVLFQFISMPGCSIFKHIQPMAMIQLLTILHKLFGNPDLQYDVAVKLKETKFSFFNAYQNKSPQLSSPTKQQIRRVETEANEENKHYDDSHLATDRDQRSAQLSEFSFATLYHTYLQRIAANVDLFRAVSGNLYPYMTAKDYVEPKLMFLWHYKIQNLLNTAIPLLQPFDLSLSEIQKQIWRDIYMFQKFLCLELQKVADCYATLPNADALSLYEILCDAQKHSKTLETFVSQAKDTFVLQAPPYPQIQQSILQDFLGFASKLKVLNQFTFKKSIKVPNKLNPCMGIPKHNPNLRHLRSISGKFLVKQQKTISPQNEIQNEIIVEVNGSNGSKEQEIADENMDQVDGGSSEKELSQEKAESVDSELAQTQKRVLHHRSQSTFHQK